MHRAIDIYTGCSFVCLTRKTSVRCSRIINSRVGIQELKKQNIIVCYDLFSLQSSLNNKLYILKLMYMCFQSKHECLCAGWFSHCLKV